MSTVVSERPQSAASPLSFTLSRGNGRSVIVAEAHGRAGGSFTDMSSAMSFVETQCRSRGCPTSMRFDESLALIRAAG